MKKYYSILMMLAMMVAALSFIACGGDDEEDDVFEPSVKGSLLVINGKTYNVSFDYQVGVIWSDPPVGSIIQFGTGKDGLVNYDKIYTFGFVAWDGSYIEPRVGLDISKIKYSLNGEPLWNFTLTDDDDNECDYVSGSLVITAIDKTQESMTLKFNDLKMSNGRISHTFNGTIKLPF